MDEPKNQGDWVPLELPDYEGCPTTRAKSTYNKEKYQANKDKILQYRKKRYKELNAYKYDIQILNGKFILSFN